MASVQETDEVDEATKKSGANVKQKIKHKNAQEAAKFQPSL